MCACFGMAAGTNGVNLLWSSSVQPQGCCQAADWESSVHCGGGVVKGPLLSLLLHGGVSRTSLYVDFGRKMGFVIKGMDQLLEKD